MDRIDLTLEGGRVYGLLGINGAGKTTLLHTICGLNRRFSGGFRMSEVAINPESDEGDWFRVKCERYLAADSPVLFGELTMRQYAEFVHKLYRRSFEEGELVELARQFHCEAYLDRTIGELSLGNKQKTVLMTGLLLNTPLFILDEPLVGLDVESIEVFYDKIREYCQRGGSVLFSSHLLEIVQRFCQSVFILDRKKIALHVPVDSNTDLHRIFFEVVRHE
ncbi:ATP-binding cassette domain-containing protein [Saccharibacillus alkalitolerans]|uniref:ATP-binding cassette domain-containing protein n=1 Tax=Saccharibacillus alkalitolerans TaxID=2705290 RepID=UPI001F2A17F2|nr:ABC transporter ATP-binding protein [Saccharibacillus alkalitolerans]